MIMMVVALMTPCILQPADVVCDSIQLGPLFINLDYY